MRYCGNRTHSKEAKHWTLLAFGHWLQRFVLGTKVSCVRPYTGSACRGSEQDSRVVRTVLSAPAVKADSRLVCTALDGPAQEVDSRVVRTIVASRAAAAQYQGRRAKARLGLMGVMVGCLLALAIGVWYQKGVIADLREQCAGLGQSSAVLEQRLGQADKQRVCREEEAVHLKQRLTQAAVRLEDVEQAKQEQWKRVEKAEREWGKLLAQLDSVKKEAAKTQAELYQCQHQLETERARLVPRPEPVRDQPQQAKEEVEKARVELARLQEELVQQRILLARAEDTAKQATKEAGIFAPTLPPPKTEWQTDMELKQQRRQEQEDHKNAAEVQRAQESRLSRVEMFRPYSVSSYGSGLTTGPRLRFPVIR